MRLSPSTEQGPRHDLEVTPSDEHAVTAVNHGVVGVELAVGLLEGLGDALDAFDDVHALEQEGVDLGGVTDDADDGLVVTLRDVRLEATSLDPRDEMIELVLRGGFLDDCNHPDAFLTRAKRHVGLTCVADYSNKSSVLVFRDVIT